MNDHSRARLTLTAAWLPPILLAIAVTGILRGADLNSIASEPDLIKRTRLALTNAEQVVAKTGKVCKEGDYGSCNEQLVEVKDSVELAMISLEKTGINPNRNLRHFKNAEIRTRKILKLLGAVQSYIHPEDESHFRAILRRVSEIDDKLLAAIMTKNKPRITSWGLLLFLLKSVVRPNIFGATDHMNRL